MATATANRGGKADPRELEAEAGGATGDMPPPDPDPNLLAPDEIEVDGTTQLELFDLGGKRPTSSKLKLAGGAIGVVDGRAFNKGDVINFSGTAVISAITQQDKRDPATNQVVSCAQLHVAHITDLRLSG